MYWTKHEVAEALATATACDVRAKYNSVRGLRDRGNLRLRPSPRGDLFTAADAMVAAILCDALDTGMSGSDLQQLANTLYQGRIVSFATGGILEINISDLLPRILTGEEWVIETPYLRQPDGSVQASSRWVRIESDGYYNRFDASSHVIAGTIQPVSDLIRRVSAVLDQEA